MNISYYSILILEHFAFPLEIISTWLSKVPMCSQLSEVFFTVSTSIIAVEAIGPTFID